jgi:hypothetical protein
MSFTIPRETVNSLNSRILGELYEPQLEAKLGSDAHLGIDTAYTVWMRSLSGMLDLIMPSESRSLVYVPPVANGISSFSINFFGFNAIRSGEANSRV